MTVYHNRWIVATVFEIHKQMYSHTYTETLNLSLTRTQPQTLHILVHGFTRRELYT